MIDVAWFVWCFIDELSLAFASNSASISIQLALCIDDFDFSTCLCRVMFSLVLDAASSVGPSVFPCLLLLLLFCCLVFSFPIQRIPSLIFSLSLLFFNPILPSNDFVGCSFSLGFHLFLFFRSCSARKRDERPASVSFCLMYYSCLLENFFTTAFSCSLCHCFSPFFCSYAGLFCAVISSSRLCSRLLIVSYFCSMAFLVSLLFFSFLFLLVIYLRLNFFLFSPLPADLVCCVHHPFAFLLCHGLLLPLILPFFVLSRILLF